MHVVIFEGSRWHTFAPISLSRPIFTLATGMGTLLDKQLHHLRPTRLTLWVRPEMEEYCRTRVVPSMTVPCAVNVPLDEEPALLVSARTVHFGRYEYPPHDAVTVDGDAVRSARVTMPGLSWEDCWNRTDRWLQILQLPRMMDQSRMVESLWDLIHWNEESLMEDAMRLPRSAGQKPAGPYHLVNEEDVWLGEGAHLQPGCVLDATKGPIVIADHATIGANAVIQGPCYIGPHAGVRPLACIRAGTSIGEVCRVGGEVANSILLGFSNKSHDGFMGHSYVGKWVNLGAGTTTSNLKNTYGEISVQIAGETVATGWRFLGALIGDHVKTGILTKLTAGSYIGFGSMMAATAIAPKFTPSFTYWTDAKTEPYRLDKVIEVAKRSFARRDRPWTPADEQIMQHVYANASRVEGVKIDAPRN
jgi:UDP-N-acetylglucosamine diphosphorylase/glucosamine-1-phosphate N-acetyltransferase